MEKQVFNKLYLITPINFCGGYDTYDSAVVCASTAQQAKKIHPGEYSTWDSSSWVSSPEQVETTLIGVAHKDTPIGVVCASFNAG